MFRLLEWFFYDVLHLAHNPDRPCPHMKGKLSDLADDTAKGIARWYTQQHVSGCPGCGSTLSGLRLIRARLLGIGKSDGAASGDGISPALSPDRRQAVADAWERIDEELAPPAGKPPR